MSNVPATNLILKKFPDKIENMDHPGAFFYGGASSRLESIPENVIAFFSGGDHTRYPAGLHPRYTLIVNLRSECSLCVDSNIFTLQPGYGILIFPFQLHYFRSSDKIHSHRRLVITFAFKNPEEMSLLPLRNQIFRINSRNAQLLCDIQTLYHKSKSQYRSEIPHLLSLFLASELNRIENKIFDSFALPLPANHFRKILDFIYANYLHPISIKQISEHIGLSSSQTRLIFKKMTNGLSLGKFIDNLRLLKSTESLMHSDRNINEIAMQFGFSDQFVFSRAFKRRFLISPLKYRILHSREKG